MPATKKSTKKRTSVKKTSPRARKALAPTMVTPVVNTPVAKPANPKFLTYGLVVVGLALLTYKFGPWLVPAIVDNRPVTRFELYKRMEKSFGAQTLEDVVSEYTLDAAIKKNDVQVDQAKIDDQIKQLETQFETTGGLDEALTQRGLTRDELAKQISTQLAVEEILKDKIEPTEEEISAYFEENKATIYVDKTLDDVKADVTEAVKQTKLRDSFLEWFGKVKEETKVKNFGL